MTNLFESIKDFFKTFADSEDPNPLHTGEVTNIWLLLTLLEEGVITYQVGLNTTTDDALIHTFNNGIQLSEITINKLKTFMIKEGIPLPPSSEDKPKSEPNAVPLGVKFTDSELVNLVSAKVAAEIVLIGQTLAMSVRNDFALLIMQFLFELLKYGTSLKTLMRQRGWMKIPPYYYSPGAPNN
ncbi:MAG: DUF3231 family protein [Heyndrickxia sp.]